MLGTVGRVQIPKLICHLAHMVEAGLEKDGLYKEQNSQIPVTRAPRCQDGDLLDELTKGPF